MPLVISPSSLDRRIGEAIEGKKTMKIRTEQQSGFWIAVDDDTYDGPPAPLGWGRTEEQAIADLKEQLEQQRIDND